MVGRAKGRGRGNQGQQTELSEMRRMIEELSRTVQDCSNRDMSETKRRFRKMPTILFYIAEGGSEDESDGEAENPFSQCWTCKFCNKRHIGREVVACPRIGCGRVKIQVDDFHGKLHAEDYLDWEATVENYFEWKPMGEPRKVLFVKLKLKGAALQWWKRVEEQQLRQGNQKSALWNT